MEVFMMKCGTCGKGCKCARLGPVSLGLGVGVTSGLAVFIWSIWIMYHGMSPMMAQLHVPVPTWGSAVIHALWTLLKGFIFGFFIAVFYDLFAWLMAKCCKKSDDTGEGGASSTEAGKS